MENKETPTDNQTHNQNSIQQWSFVPRFTEELINSHPYSYKSRGFPCVKTHGSEKKKKHIDPLVTRGNHGSFQVLEWEKVGP